MTDSARHAALLLKRRSLRVGISAVVGAAIACGGGPPFNSYDPPPTFAIHYRPATLDVAATYAGADFNGSLVVDLVDQTFTTTGSTREFGQRFMPFTSYTTIDGARWPARWHFNPVAGCGAGIGFDADIRTKIIEVVCTPQPRTISISPSDYQGNTPPSSLQVYFDTGVVPPGTAVSLYVVDPSSQSVISSENTTVDGGGAAAIPAPSLYNGYYYVLADVSSDENGADAEFMVRDNPAGGLSLGPDQSVGVDQVIYSSDGRFRLQYQGSDGNLVLLDVTTQPWTVLWSSNTAGYSAGNVLMQSNGELVIYDAGSSPIWSSGTGGNSYAYLIVQNDGNMVIYNSIGTSPLWATGTCCR
jgi:hypothetical protein